MACFGCWLGLLSTNLRGVGCPRCGKVVRSRVALSAVPFA
jgi:endogenous inhibitor of DNA gyrase (YacG/DUF329 family)